jgi:P-type E1-E2 ATPase
LIVGDVVKVTKNQGIPADLILISVDNTKETCYVETKNLDGETNLKAKTAIQTDLKSQDSLFEIKAEIEA